MTLIQLLIIAFSIFAISRLHIKRKSGIISRKEFFLWLFFWLLVISATIWFRKTDIVANFFGISRGADLAVYVSVLALFYLVFHIIAKLDKLEREITIIVREIAKNKKTRD